MKLLVAIESSDIKLVNKSLRWVGRAGYDLRIFVKGMDWEPYVDRLKDINQNHYLHLTQKNLVVDDKPMDYAIREGYDLLLTIKETRPAFSMKRKRIDLDAEVPKFIESVGMARKMFNASKGMMRLRLAAGVTMVRVGPKDGKEASTA